MDANGLNFWMLHAAADWLPQGGADGLHYCSRSGRLQLRSQRMGTAPTEDSAAASALVETAPMCRDSFGNQARWDATSRTVVAAGAGVGDVVIYTPPAGQTVTDLAMGHDGVLYLAVSGTLVLVDRRNRWPNFTLIDATFAFWRLKALPQGGVLALDRAAPQLGVVTGLPLQVEPSDVPNPGILRSCVENGDPPRIVRRHPLPATEKFVAIAAMSPGRFLLLSWAAAAPANTAAFLRIHDARTGLSSAWTFSETKYPYGVAWLGDKRVGILATGLNEALIYDLDGSPATLVAAGDTYILSGRNVDPFVQSFDATPSYAFGGAIHPLLPLSLNSLAASGATTVPKLIDSGAARTTWHRLLLEAVVPPRCGVVVRLAASDSAADFGAGAANPVTWHAHAFGATRPDAKTPLATWLPVASEVPFGKPLLDEPPIADRQGLFMVLVQRSGTAVRDLSGRYLGIRVELAG
ncbi:MAG TPA: hypothetical protein VMQ73_14005, partial [Methylomirabilota bacterium]|nr:hypothetical protein [Methylomirabilota bacterium]